MIEGLLVAPNLRETLYPDGVNQWELAQLLLDHFHSAREVNEHEIAYGDVGETFAVKLRYKDGVLTEVLSGSRLSDTDVSTLSEKLARDVLNAKERHTASHVLFANLTVEGWFRYRDLFQLVPVPSDAPRPAGLIGDCPFILEYAYNGSPDISIRSLRQVSIAREIELICFGLLMFLGGSTRRFTRFRWVFDRTPDNSQLVSRHMQEGYAYLNVNPPGLMGFTPTADIPELTRQPPSDYYSLMAISAGQRFTVPANLESLLDAYFSLEQVMKDRFLRACFWLKHAIEMHYYAQSAMYMALIGAIETLIPESKETARCNHCGQRIGPSSSKNFADFLDKYVPGTDLTEKERKNFYSIRSALSHGGTLLLQDQRAWHSMNPKGIQQDRSVRTMQQIVRIALVNWLFERSAGLHSPS